MFVSAALDSVVVIAEMSLITQQAILAPAFPVLLLSSSPP